MLAVVLWRSQMRSTASGLPLGPKRAFSCRDRRSSYGVVSDPGPLGDRNTPTLIRGVNLSAHGLAVPPYFSTA